MPSRDAPLGRYAKPPPGEFAHRAIALLTTLYGALIAFLICGPIAEKLVNRTGEEAAVKKMAIAGVESILKGDNSMVIQSKLMAFLSPEEREAITAE